MVPVTVPVPPVKKLRFLRFRFRFWFRFHNTASNASAPKAVLAASKAATIGGVQSTAAVALGLPRVESVRGYSYLTSNHLTSNH
jgi:hypothetical protein